MSLEKYKQKRSFNKTPEPTGGKSVGDALTFVVQKHAASHLHYDFRLEMRGVLKSWAVPKGPSLNPDDRRLAMMVEDHPFDYKNFEGIIPKGNYGAGTVIIWDEGTYELTEKQGESKKEQEKSLLGHLYKGSLKITLHGKKLNGDFALVKAKDEEQDNAWFLIKIKDKHASKADITKKDKSVVSGLTLEQMASKKDAKTWKSNRSSKHEESEEEQTSAVDLSLLESGTKAAFPTKVQPMLATLIKAPFNNADWLYEVKWDGFRVIAFVNNGKVTLHSRSGLNYTKNYPAVVEALEKLPYNAVIDGEVVVTDKNGKPDFDALQAYNGTDPLLYYTFDLLWLNGYDITGLELNERKALLVSIIPEDEVLRYSDHFDDGEQLFEQVKEMGLEGIVAKRRNSLYRQGKRSKDWLKLPTEIKQEFVIGGWTESEGGRQFRSLLFGAFEEGKLHFIGHAGLGFKDAEMAPILNRLKKLEVKKNPFVNEVDYETKPHWVKAELVALLKFATWTKGGKIRKPAIFLGFRDDKKAEEVFRELPANPAEVITATPEQTVVEENEKSNWAEIEKQKITSESEVEINGKPVILSNVERTVWKNIPKASLIEYYHKVSDYILPYLIDRPQSLNVRLYGANKPGFYIKDMEGHAPGWAEIYSVQRKHKKAGKRDQIDYFVCQDEAALLYLVNLGCVDINPWTARTTSPTHPDYIVIDLDPSDDKFAKAVEGAMAVKDFVDQEKLSAFVKTSGKTGIHILLPCSSFNFNQARSIAENICSIVHQTIPSISTTEISVSQRGDKLYLDPNQNDEADTIAAPYSARPFHHPTVSTPLDWKEIKPGLDSLQFDINTIFNRLEKKGDLFKGLFLKKNITANNKKLLKFL